MSHLYSLLWVVLASINILFYFIFLLDGGEKRKKHKAVGICFP